ncbi:MAG TPA: glutathione S-transferase family protein [Thermodesulfobacteriota bacterium]|nr:glutathione S-transferase family protein [Thermodesulfobacteriota bacterium]
MIKLYDFPRCPYCRKVRIALVEKQIPYEQIFVDLNKKEQRKPKFLKLNPNGKVPVIADGSKIIYESTIINEYLDEKYPLRPLLPKELYTKALTRMLIEYCEKTFHTYVFGIYKELKLKNNLKANQKLIELNLKNLDTELKYLNGILKGHNYITGRFSLADVAFMPRILLLDYLDIHINSKYKYVLNWIDKLKIRESSKIVLEGNL